MIRNRVVILLVAASLTTGACGRMRDSRAVEDRSPAMVLLPDATELQYFLNHDEWGRQESEQLDYVIASDFPSAAAICRVTADLKQAGWRPLQRVDDDSGTESSFTQGWRVNTSRKGRPDEARIDLWQADWTNQEGDYLAYFLTYRSPAGAERGTSMRVGGLRTPAYYVKAFKKPIGISIPDTVPPRIFKTEIADCR